MPRTHGEHVPNDCRNDAPAADAGLAALLDAYAAWAPEQARAILEVSFWARVRAVPQKKLPYFTDRLEDWLGGAVREQRRAADIHGLTVRAYEPGAPIRCFSRSEISGKRGGLSNDELTEESMHRFVEVFDALIVEFNTDPDGCMSRGFSAGNLAVEIGVTLHAVNIAQREHKWFGDAVAARQALLVSVIGGYAIARGLRSDQARDAIRIAELIDPQSFADLAVRTRAFEAETQRKRLDQDVSGNEHNGRIPFPAGSDAEATSGQIVDAVAKRTDEHSLTFEDRLNQALGTGGAAG